MRVLIIVPEVVRYGGTGRFVERLLEFHARRGIETTLLAPAGQCHPGLTAVVERHGAELLLAPNRACATTHPALTQLFDLLYCWRAVRSRRPDLVVVSTGDPGRMSVALYLPVPVLYILHSTPEQRLSFPARSYLKLGALLGNRVMTVSEACAGEVSQTMGVPRSRISVVHNSCRGTGEPPARGEALVLTLGHLVGYKNPWIWLEVAGAVLQHRPDVRFVWLGDGEELLPLRARVREMALEERILLPGYVEDPASWFARASIYLQPSLRESHGIAVLEAMSHGLPCVVANTGGLPESVLDGETGFICRALEVADFAGRIAALLDDAALRERMGGAGRSRAEQRFSEQDQELKIMALYDTLTKKQAPR